MTPDSLLDIRRYANPEEVVGKLKSSSEGESVEAGKRLLREARRFGIPVRDYLTLAIEPKDSLDGYERACAYLNLPLREDLKNGVLLQAASETFQTYPGTRAMFPEVISDMLRWADRMAVFEKVEDIVAASRTISGTELIRTVVDDDSAERDTFIVPEMARIPVRTLRTSENSVKIWKHGSGIKTSYEFSRRARLDILRPFINRIARELDTSKVTAAVNTLVNGDGVNGAATVTAQSTYNTPTGTTATNGVLNWKAFVYWLIQRAKAGTPVDTVIGNWDSAWAWADKFFGTQSSTFGMTMAQLAEAFGVKVENAQPANPLATVRFTLASQMPANKLLGITKGECVEELVEAGSRIEEEDRIVANQTVTYYKTENTGYSLVFPDAREIFDFGS